MDSSYLDYFKSGPGAVISEWKKYNVTLGKEVTIKTVKENYSGFAVDLDVNGALIVEDAKGHKKRFSSGEVSLEKTL
jgi:BirA family biotin operon repressor/biotin-[acetyl-CoA-carboxylase] ligase